jgi:hypothetical protein
MTIVFSDKDINKLNKKVNNAMNELFKYFRKNKLILNVKKSSFILISLSDQKNLISLSNMMENQ